MLLKNEYVKYINLCSLPTLTWFACHVSIPSKVNYIKGIDQ